MYRIFSALSMLSFAFSIPKWTQLQNYTFDQYCIDFNKIYTAEELPLHKTAFETKLQDIFAHNANPKFSWKIGVTHHSDDITPKLNFGYSKSLKSEINANNQRFLEQQQKFPDSMVADLPKEFDWRKLGKVTPIKNQQSCGSCWAFTTIEVIESHVAINSGNLIELSAQQLVNCAKNPLHCGGTGGCSGLIPEIGYNYAQLFGMVSETKMPYHGVDEACTYDGSVLKADVRLDGYEKLPENDYNAVMWYLVNKGPLAISVAANQGWLDYEEGVFDGCPYDQNISMNHAVTLVGYGTDAQFGDYWIVRNHWGVNWGEEGYIKLARSSTPQCGLDTTPADGSACTGDGQLEQKVCGTCAILYDLAYPIRARMV